MNKLLVLSVALNIALLVGGGAWVWRGGESAGAVESDSALVAGSPAPVAVLAEPDSARRNAFPDLGSLEPEEQVAALEAAGWSAEDAKLYALGRLMRESMQNMKGMMPKREYWESFEPFQVDWESQRKMMETQFRMQEVMKDLFGDEVSPMFGVADLPFSSEKTRAAMMVQMDYQMMGMKLREDSGGIMLEEDIQAQKLLEEERREDLAAVLSPEELFEFEIRTSGTAMSLRQQLGTMNATEKEFREVFRWKQELERLESPQGEVSGEAGQQQRSETEAAMKAALVESFGEDRYKQYERSQDWGYGRLQSVVKRLELPEDRVDEVYDAKDFAESSRESIMQNGALSSEEREEALQALKTETREEVTELLGKEGLTLYREQGGGHWLHSFQ